MPLSFTTSFFFLLFLSLTLSASNATVIDNMMQVWGPFSITGSTAETVEATTPGAEILGNQVRITIINSFTIDPDPTTAEGTGSGGYTFTGTPQEIQLLYTFASPVDLTAGGADR